MEKQCERAEMVSFLYTLPGDKIRKGGFAAPLLVLARRRCVCVVPHRIYIYKKVSCISLAGWSSGMFNAVKLCQSSSISLSSSTVKPIRLNSSIILFLTNCIGCLAPVVVISPGNVRSIVTSFCLLILGIFLEEGIFFGRLFYAVY